MVFIYNGLKFNYKNRNFYLYLADDFIVENNTWHLVVNKGRIQDLQKYYNILIRDKKLKRIINEI